MNCREGDRVIFVGGVKNLGKIGKIHRAGAPGDIGYLGAEINGLGHTWFCECLSKDGWVNQFGIAFEFSAVADKFLKPIRDPSDDAQDESLSWKKVPSTDKREELA